MQASEAQLQKVEAAAAAVSNEAVGQLLVHVRRESAEVLWTCVLQSMAQHCTVPSADSIPGEGLRGWCISRLPQAPACPSGYGKNAACFEERLSS